MQAPQDLALQEHGEACGDGGAAGWQGGGVAGWAHGTWQGRRWRGWRGVRRGFKGQRCEAAAGAQRRRSVCGAERPPSLSQKCSQVALVTRLPAARARMPARRSAADRATGSELRGRRGCQRRLHACPAACCHPPVQLCAISCATTLVSDLQAAPGRLRPQQLSHPASECCWGLPPPRPAPWAAKQAAAARRSSVQPAAGTCSRAPVARQQRGSHKGEAGVLHAAVGEGGRQQQQVVDTPHVLARQLDACTAQQALSAAAGRCTAGASLAPRHPGTLLAMPGNMMIRPLANCCRDGSTPPLPASRTRHRPRRGRSPLAGAPHLPSPQATPTHPPTHPRPGTWLCLQTRTRPPPP
jgi:hypothetical protein